MMKAILASTLVLSASIAAAISAPDLQAGVRTEGIVLHTDASPREIAGVFRHDTTMSDWVPSLKSSSREWPEETSSKDEWKMQRLYVRRLFYTSGQVFNEGQALRFEFNNMRRWKREETKITIGKASACFRASRVPTGEHRGKTRLAFRIDGELNIPKWMGGKALEKRMVRRFTNKFAKDLRVRLDSKNKPEKLSGEIPKGKKRDASPLCERL